MYWRGDLLRDHTPEVLESKDMPIESLVPSGNNLEVTVVSVPSSLAMRTPSD